MGVNLCSRQLRAKWFSEIYTVVFRVVENVAEQDCVLQRDSDMVYCPAGKVFGFIASNVGESVSFVN